MSESVHAKLLQQMIASTLTKLVAFLIGNQSSCYSKHVEFLKGQPFNREHFLFFPFSFPQLQKLPFRELSSVWARKGTDMIVAFVPSPHKNPPAS